MSNDRATEPSAEATEKAHWLQWLLSHPNYQDGDSGKKLWLTNVGLAFDAFAAQAVQQERDRIAVDLQRSFSPRTNKNETLLLECVVGRVRNFVP